MFGKPLDQAWHDWVAWEHAYQQANLALVHEHPITPYKEIARRGARRTVPSLFSADKQTLYAAFRYPGASHTWFRFRWPTARSRNLRR